MRNKNIVISVFTTVSIVILLGSLQGEPAYGAKKYLLQYDIPETSRFTLTNTTEFHNRRVFMGNAVTDSSVDRVEYGFEAKSSGDDGLELEVVFLGREHQLYDSPSQGSTDYSDLIGKKVSLHLSPEGEMTSLVGFEDLPVIKILDRDITLGKERYENEIRQLFPHLPGKKIQTGDSWSHVQEYEEPIQGGKIRVTIHYTHSLVEEVKKDGLDCLRLDGKYTISIEGKGGSKGVEFSLKLDGGGTETVYFDWKKGMLLSISGKASVEGAAENKGLGFSMTLEQTFENTIDVKLERR